MPDIFSTIVLGVVEGLTEFLPVSSTGHLILASEILGINQTEFVKSFEIAIQLGAIIAVAVLYGRKLFCERGILARALIAFIPTGIVGLALYQFIKRALIGNVPVVLWALFVGGLALILFERWYRGREETAVELSEMSMSQAFFIGLCQSISVIPGVSRAAATIVGGLLFGFKREAIVEFSFLLAIPTMAAATGFDLLKTSAVFSAAEWQLLALGFFASFVSALFAIKFFLSFVKTHSFASFGVYRVVVSALFFLWLL